MWPREGRILFWGDKNAGDRAQRGTRSFIKAPLRYGLLDTGTAKLAMRPNTAEEEKRWGGQGFSPQSQIFWKKKKKQRTTTKQKWPSLINLPKLMRGWGDKTKNPKVGQLPVEQNEGRHMLPPPDPQREKAEVTFSFLKQPTKQSHKDANAHMEDRGLLVSGIAWDPTRGNATRIPVSASVLFRRTDFGVLPALNSNLTIPEPCELRQAILMF